jgi:hypothetical protein
MLFTLRRSCLQLVIRYVLFFLAQYFRPMSFMLRDKMGVWCHRASLYVHLSVHRSKFWNTWEIILAPRTNILCSGDVLVLCKILTTGLKSEYSKMRFLLIIFCFDEVIKKCKIRSALFWDIKRRRVIIVYRRFGTTYRSHLQGSRVREESENKR